MHREFRYFPEILCILFCRRRNSTREGDSLEASPGWWCVCCVSFCGQKVQQEQGVSLSLHGFSKRDFVCRWSQLWEPSIRSNYKGEKKTFYRDNNRETVFHAFVFSLQSRWQRMPVDSVEQKGSLASFSGTADSLVLVFLCTRETRQRAFETLSHSRISSESCSASSSSSSSSDSQTPMSRQSKA